MKLKYYLRGLGVGIICTAIIMGIALSGNKKETLTDAEVIERARLLGMVMEEEGTNAGKDTSDQEKPEEGKMPEAQDTGKEQPDSDKTTDTKGNGTEAGNPESDENTDAGAADSENPNGQPSAAGQGTVELEIKEGEFSDVVSRKLFEAGLVPDAEEFNTYMTQKGVDDSLRIGVHLIPAGSTADEIIAILQEKPQ